MKVRIKYPEKDEMVTVFEGEVKHLIFMPRMKSPPPIQPVYQTENGTVVFIFAVPVTVRKRLNNVWVRRV